MIEFHWYFFVERTMSPDGIIMYRATHDDNFAIWGWGDTPYEAIAALQEEMPSEWWEGEESLTPLESEDAP